MTNSSRESDFRTLVLRRYDGLPGQQQVAASFFLDHLQDIPFLSVPELARRAEVSEATIVRFAQRIGYTGFSDLKADLLDALRDSMALHPELDDGVAEMEEESEQETLIAVAQQDIRNIQRTLESLDRDAFHAVASAIFKADHVYSFGLGISAQFAELVTYLLTQIGLRGTTLSSKFTSPLEQVVAFRPTDLLIAFSFPPYSRPTIELVKMASERGVVTVAISDRASAPVARVARHVLTMHTENLLFTNSFAALSVLLNSLATAVALQHRAHVVEAVSQINRILESDDQLIQP